MVAVPNKKEKRDKEKRRKLIRKVHSKESITKKEFHSILDKASQPIERGKLSTLRINEKFILP